MGVLGLAKIGLIFTRSQEGTQPGQLTQTGQKNPGYSIPCDNLLDSEWRSWLGGGWSWLGSALGIRQWELLCALCCLFCIFFLSVLLLLLFASFAVLLNCPYPEQRVLPSCFHSPPHPSRGKGNRATAWPFVAGQGQITTIGITEKVPVFRRSFMAQIIWSTVVYVRHQSN